MLAVFIQQHSRRAVPFSACSTSPAPLDFACFREKVLLVNGGRLAALLPNKADPLLALGRPASPALSHLSP